jgi:dihydrodipicolinate synthase/N-acetylneuraminate lyase
MSRLTADKLRGIWAGVTMTWDGNFKFDEATYADNVRRCIKARVAGLYTTGSTGEFYAITFDEFRRMVDIQAELCGAAKMPLQIGCCADATYKTIGLLEYAAGRKEVGAAQVNIPYWMELTDRELLQFFKDLYTACPDMPLVHYNIPRTKRFLHGPDYLRILDVAPSLIGVKYTYAGTHFSQLQDDIAMTPMLSYFVAENVLVSGMQIGARGSCSSLVATNPKFTLDMYAKARAGKWNEAMKMQKHAARFFADTEAFVSARGEGSIDPVFDKGLAVAAGCVLGHQRCRAPYIGWSDETVKAVRAWLKKKYPEFVYPGSR